MANSKHSGRLSAVLWLIVFAAFFSLSIASPVLGQQIGSGISAKEAYVDSQIVFQIKIATSGSKLNDFTPPEAPKVDGLKIESAGPPSRSSSIRIINGRRSASNTLTYNFLVSPNRVGEFTLPPVNVSVGGKKLSTKPHSFVVSKSETGDLLFVELESERKQAYVGEAVKLTLKVWLRGFSDREQRIQLNEQQMWQAFNRAQSEWGVFGERLEELAAERKRPAGQDVLRKDSEGVSRAYLLYEIESTMYPKRPGQIDPGSVRIVVDYPTKVSRPRSSFGGSIFGPSLIDEMMGTANPVQASRPISAEATAPPVQIVDVPSKGRPADYRGAVGRYKLLVEADTKRVKVGEPIGLRVFIQGDGPMELVEAPPLATIANLTQDFRVEDKALAGFVQGDAKVFATSIRPRSDTVTQVPPIPFSFFDPDERAFQTVYSAAIPIMVEPNESLSMDSIVANKKQPKNSRPDEASETAPVKDDGIQGVEEMLKVADQDSASKSWLAFAIAPLLCVATFAGLFATRRMEMPQLWLRKKTPHAAAMEALAKADSASEIRDALDMPGIALTDEAREVRVECDRVTFSPDSQGSHRVVQALKQKAIDALRSSAMMLIGLTCVMMFTDGTVASPNAPKPSLSSSQIETILQEAHAEHLSAKKLLESDPAAAKSQLAVAISKYRLVAESGWNAAAMQLNLGDAHQHNDEWVLALAAYESANRTQPSREARKRIALVREKLGEASNAKTDVSTFVRAVPRSVWWWCGLIGWSVFWLVLAVSLRAAAKPRRWLFALAFSLLCIFVFSFVGIRSVGSHAFDALATVDGAELRAADGEFSEVVDVVRLGESLVIKDRRGDWLNVATLDQKQGWLRTASVAEVSRTE